jgi:hypothetical protein
MWIARKRGATDTHKEVRLECGTKCMHCRMVVCQCGNVLEQLLRVVVRVAVHKHRTA